MLSVDLLIHFIVDFMLVVGYLYCATSHEQEGCCIEYQPGHIKPQVITAMLIVITTAWLSAILFMYSLRNKVNTELETMFLIGSI